MHRLSKYREYIFGIHFFLYNIFSNKQWMIQNIVETQRKLEYIFFLTTYSSNGCVEIQR